MTILAIFITVLLSVLQYSCCFKWHLSDVLPSDKILTFSERYMFATKNGPIILDQGSSYIDIDVNINVYLTEEKTPQVAFVVYSVLEEKHQNDTINGLCVSSSKLPSYSYWAHHPVGGDTRLGTDESDFVPIKLTNQGKMYVYNKVLGLNGTFYKYSVPIKYKYPVYATLWHNVAFKFCDSNIIDAKAQIDGDITFRNPYGYLPGELFGFLPFEGARMIAYVLFGIYYIYTYFVYNSSVLPLHHAILFVYIIALTEATVWYAAYQNINLTGEPYCCPFPSTVVASLILQVFRQTFSRTLLLVVCLGYGIVRPKLLPSEWIAVTVMSILYFMSALLAQVSTIVITNDVRNVAPKSVLVYELPGFFFDVLIITWTYFALGSTIRILTEFKQTQKLRMYTQLATIIAIFVALFSVVAILIILDKFNYMTWPWQVAWLREVLWEVLNFAVLAAVCIICQPSENSRLLSYASQLPTEDPDLEDELDEKSKGLHINYHDDDTDFDFGADDDDDGFEMTSTRIKADGDDGSYNALPEAGDEEFGLED